MARESRTVSIAGKKRRGEADKRRISASEM